MLRTLFALQGVPLGFPAERVLTMRVPLSPQRYPDPARRGAFFREVLAGIAGVPGVTLRASTRVFTRLAPGASRSRWTEGSRTLAGSSCTRWTRATCT